MALALLDHAVEAYSNSNYFTPEKARASFKRAKALRALERGKDADAEISKCFRMYKLLFTELVRTQRANGADRKANEKDLTDADVNKLVAFWSK